MLFKRIQALLEARIVLAFFGQFGSAHFSSKANPLCNEIIVRGDLGAPDLLKILRIAEDTSSLPLGGTGIVRHLLRERSASARLDTTKRRSTDRSQHSGHRGHPCIVSLRNRLGSLLLCLRATKCYVACLRRRIL